MWTSFFLSLPGCQILSTGRGALQLPGAPSWLRWFTATLWNPLKFHDRLCTQDFNDTMGQKPPDEASCHFLSKAECLRFGWRLECQNACVWCTCSRGGFFLSFTTWLLVMCLHFVYNFDAERIVWRLKWCDMVSWVSLEVEPRGPSRSLKNAPASTGSIPCRPLCYISHFCEVWLKWHFIISSCMIYWGCSGAKSHH